MTTTPGRAAFLLVPGAGGDGWLWHRVVDELLGRGHEAVAVTLPTGDPTARMTEYAQAAVSAASGLTARPLVVVGLSLGGFSAPLAAQALRADLLVLLNAMVPRPGESAAEWWDATRHEEALRERADDGDDVFFHDVPPDVRAQAYARGEGTESPAAFAQPWPLPAWPDVPTRVLAGRDDRFFPPEFQRRVAADRLGLEADEMPGGHLLPLSRPRELADRLAAYLSALPAVRDVPAGSR